MSWLVIEEVTGDWLVDGGTERRVCGSGADLLAALERADREDAPDVTSRAIVVEAAEVHGGWVLSWRVQGRPRTVVVRSDPESAQRAWSLLTERLPSLGNFVDRLETLAYAGSPNDSLSFELGGTTIEVDRLKLRQVSKGVRLARTIGKLISISPRAPREGS